jgi:PAS domain-containing protein
VAHVELSLSESLSVPIQGITDWNSVDRWTMAVDGATEPCLVIDVGAIIAAVSAPACALLGFQRPEDAVGQCLYADVLPLVDFTAAAGALAEGEVARIPPVLALTSGRLARGLMRTRAHGEIITMDALSTPLFESDTVIGSLTFFCVV